jgi:BCD family chlorophyll transporter-like MFS transporter
LLALAASGLGLAVTALPGCIFALGLANGIFAVSAIGAMMQLAGERRQGAGTSMGLFGAAQAIAFGAGCLISSGASDLGRRLLGSPLTAYASVFTAEAALFGLAAWLATRIFDAAPKLSPGTSWSTAS